MSVVENIVELNSTCDWVHLGERSASASGQWHAQIIEALAQLSDDELLSITKSVQAHGFNELDGEFVQGCVNLQLSAEIQRRIARQLAAEPCAFAELPAAWPA
jgi:hypothetical protein